MKTNFASFLVVLALAATFAIARAEEKTNAAPFHVTHADAKEAAKLVTRGDVTVLDIRTPKEFADGHITGATNIDFQASDFATQVGKLDREKPYLLHCGSGRRSTNCLPQLEKLGFKHIIHLDGGLKAWQAAGNPVEKR